MTFYSDLTVFPKKTKSKAKISSHPAIVKMKKKVTPNFNFQILEVEPSHNNNFGRLPVCQAMF